MILNDFDRMFTASLTFDPEIAKLRHGVSEFVCDARKCIDGAITVELANAMTGRTQISNF